MNCLMSSSPWALWAPPLYVYLSAPNFECSPFAVASHLDGPFGLCCDGHPGAPSAGYGSPFTGPWWWQWGSEKSEQ